MRRNEPENWASEMTWMEEDDHRLPAALSGANLVLNRARLAAFLTGFRYDSDIRDLLWLDVIGTALGAPVTSTGVVEPIPSLAARPFRLWEYAWLYKGLRLFEGGLDVLDLGGPASHVVVLAGAAGNRVISIDINPIIVDAGHQCARILNLPAVEPRTGDMRDLSAFPDESFDRIVCCSVLEHLTAQDQERSLCEMNRVLRPGGAIGLTFDYGPAAPGANEHLPPPHEPPANAAEVIRRYTQGQLTVVGNAAFEDPIPGSLFHSDVVRYTMAALFLYKPPSPRLKPPAPETGRASVLINLAADMLPRRMFEYAGRLEQLQTAQASVERQVEIFQTTAAERLRALEVKEAALNAVRTEADRRASLLDAAIAEANTQRLHAEALEATAAERLRELRAKDAALGQMQVEAERRAVALQVAAAAREELEATAAERLRELRAKDTALSQMRAQAEQLAGQLNAAAEGRRELEATAAERLRELEAKDTALSQMRAQAEQLAGQLKTAAEGRRELETAAAERLRELEAKDASLSQMRAQAEQLTGQLNAAAEGCKELERAAEERLRELQAKEQALRALHAGSERLAHELQAAAEGRASLERRVQALEAASEEHLRNVQDQERTIAALKREAGRRGEELERTATRLEEREAALKALESERKNLQAAHDELLGRNETLARKIGEFEKETLRQYIVRKWGRGRRS